MRWLGWFLVVGTTVAALGGPVLAAAEPQPPVWQIGAGTLELQPAEAGSLQNGAAVLDVPENVSHVDLRWRVEPRANCSLPIGGASGSPAFFEVRASNGRVARFGLDEGIHCRGSAWTTLTRMVAAAGGWDLRASGRGSLNLRYEAYGEGRLPETVTTTMPPTPAGGPPTGWAIGGLLLVFAWSRARRGAMQAFVILAFARVDRERALEHPRRRRIHEFLGQTEAATLAELARHLELSKRAVTYHVAVLQRVGLLASMPVGRTRLVGQLLRGPVHRLSREADRIRNACAATGGVSRRELGDQLQLPLHVVKYHVKQLVRRGMLVVDGGGRPRRYRAADSA